MDVDRSISDLNGKYLPFEHKTHGKAHLNVMANPIQLVEIIFPKEHLDCMVNTLGGEEGLKGQKTTKFLQKYITWFRKFAKLQPIKNINPDTPKLPIHFENTEIIGLGFKDDTEFQDGTEFI